MKEQELASKCAQADKAARKLLYEQYGGQLMAICMRYIGDRDSAEDVFHDGFIRIYQSIQKFDYRGEGSLKAWMARVMVNESLAYLRKKSIQQQQEVVADEIPDCEAEEEDMEEIPHSVVMKMIEELPQGYRTVFNLFVLEEKSHKEIAELLGITEHTSSSQYYRARTLMMKKINEYNNRNK